MATTGADFLQGLNMILTSQQERERFRVTQALAMMQYAQQKKMQDIQIASESLKLAQVANEEMKGKVASRWLSLTGIGAVYAGGEGQDRVDNITDAVGLLEDKGFKPTDAQRIATAVWSHHETKDSSPIISLATELGGILDAEPDELTAYQKRFYAPFTALGLTGDEIYKTTKSAMQIQENEFNISKEMMQFTQKDYDVQSDIKILSDAEMAMPKGIPSSQFQITDDDMEDQADLAGLYSEKITGILGELDTLKSNVKAKKSSLRSLSNEIKAAKKLKEMGMEISPTQAALIQDEDEARSKIEDDITVLSKSIEDKRKKGEALTVLNREEAIRTGQVEMGPGITHFGIDPLQKMGLWWQTGVWPDDDLLKAAEDIAEKKRSKYLAVP